jgi:cell division protein FtsI (penicillin-binding protein 3)
VGNTVHQRRIVVASALCVMAFSLVGLRLIDVSILHATGAGAGAIDHPLTARADITDRNGELLARDLPVHDLYARPHAFEDKNQAAHELALATGMDQGRLNRVFAGKRPYVLVARRLSPDAEDRVMSLGLPGLDFMDATKRFYPKGRAAVQVLGTTDPDGHGVSGLELGLDPKLRGEIGRAHV